MEALDVPSLWGRIGGSCSRGEIRLLPAVSVGWLWLLAILRIAAILRCISLTRLLTVRCIWVVGLLTTVGLLVSGNKGLLLLAGSEFERARIEVRRRLARHDVVYAGELRWNAEISEQDSDW